MQENMQENERLPLLGGVKIAPNNMITANRATVSKSKVQKNILQAIELPSPVEEDVEEDIMEGNNVQEGDGAGDELGATSDDVHEAEPSNRKQERFLGYLSDSSAIPATYLGSLRRKPRWTTIRSKSSSVLSDSAHIGEIQQRSKLRRNRLLRSKDVYNYDQDVDRLRLPPRDHQKGRVAAYCTCDQIVVLKLLKWLNKLSKEHRLGDGWLQGSRLQLHGWKHTMYMGVIHSTHASSERRGVQNNENTLRLRQKDVFYFATGCIVFWGLTHEEESMHLQALKAFSTGPVAQIEIEDMEFVYGESSSIANDAITLSSNDVAEKLAISFAMAQSAKLDVFEERVEKRIRSTKHIPFNLATTGSIQYSQKDISKLIGELFIELADVNLHSDILDEPDFLWDNDHYEPLYKRMIKYLDVNNRVKILNKRLDILRELVEVLNQELTQQHGAKLEWIIIWLLVAEILISVGWNIIVKDIFGYFHS